MSSSKPDASGETQPFGPGEGGGAAPSAAAPSPAPAAAPAPVATPQTRIGRYVLLEELGRGAQGAVYRAEDTRLQRRVALKVLNASFAASKDMLLRFEREAAAASRLDHPGICAVYEAGTADGVPFIAMRYIDGQTLARQIALTRLPTTPTISGEDETVVMEQPTAAVAASSVRSGTRSNASSIVARAEVLRLVALIEKAARALHAAHEAGLIHRDIKPGNIMVTRTGDPVILDFGLARAEGGDLQTLTQSGDILGTPAYMSPEQLRASQQQVDRRSDVYSLGVTLFECLTLQRPFDAPSREGLYQQILNEAAPDPIRLNRNVSRDLKVVLETAMEKDRDRRYKTAHDFAEDLRRVRSYEPIQARPAGMLLRFQRWTQRNPRIAMGTVGLFLLLTLGLATSLGFLQRLHNEQGQTRLANQRLAAESIEKEKALKAVERERDATARALAAREEALQARGEALRRAEGLRLAAQASSALATNPGVALLLALEAAERDAGPVLSRILAEALRQHRELKVLGGGGVRAGTTHLSADGRLALVPLADRGLKVVQTMTGGLIAFLRTASPSYQAAEFSPDQSHVLLLNGYSPSLEVWNIAGQRQVAVLGGHRAHVLDGKYAPSGDRIASASGDGTVRLWNAATGELQSVLDTRESAVNAVAFSADGKLLLTASAGVAYAVTTAADGRVLTTRISSSDAPTTARLWDVETGKELQRFRGHRGAVTAALSPDGKLAYSTSRQLQRHSGRIWDAATGQELFELPLERVGRFQQITSAVFTPDSQRLVTVREAQSSGHYAAVVWEARTGRKLHELRGHLQPIVRINISPDGRRAVTVSNDTTARLYDLDSGAPLLTLLGHDAPVHDARFLPDSNWLATASDDGTVRRWDAEVDRKFAAVPINIAEPLRHVVFTPDGSRLLTLTMSQATVWDAESGEARGQPFDAEAKSGWLSKLVPVRGGQAVVPELTGARFSGDGSRLLIWAGPNLQVWDGEGRNRLGKWELPMGAPWQTPLPAMTSDGKYVLCLKATARSAGLLELITDAGEPAARAPEAPPGTVVSVCDALSGKELHALVGHPAPVRSIQVGQTSQRALTVGGDSELRVWDIETGRAVATFQDQNAAFASATLSPDGTRIATTSWGPQIRFYDVESAQPPLVRESSVDAEVRPDFNRDGSRLVTALRDHTAVIWDTASGEPIAILRGHIGRISAVGFSPGGGSVVTASEDQTARVWDAATGKELIVLPHSERFRSAAFTLDERRVLTVTDSGIARRWPLNLIDEARRLKHRDLTPDEADRYEVGTPEERRAYRQQKGLETVFETMEAAQTLDDGNQPMLHAALQSLLQVLPEKPGVADSEAALERARSAVAAFPGQDPVVLELLAEVEARFGRLRDSILTLERAALLPEAPPSIFIALEKRRGALLPDLVSCASIAAVLDDPEWFIPEGATWKFFRGRTSPSPGLEWTAIDFDDAPWEEGPSGFGYGDGDDATVLQDMRGNYTTVYLRREFTVDDPSRLDGVTLSILVDDGCVAYLNGKELGRVRARGAGELLSHLATATSTADEPAATVELPVPLKLLRKGRNVLAILGLNASAQSTDLSLIPVLRGSKARDLASARRRLQAFTSQASPTGAAGRIAYCDGRLLLREGKPADAVPRLQLSASREPGVPEPVLALGQALIESGRPGEAEAQLRAELTVRPASAASVWDLWWDTAVARVKLPADQLLAWLDETKTTASPRAAELRWALERLVADGAIRINAGGSEVTSSSGKLYAADRFFRGGEPSTERREPISDTDSDALYQTNRWFSRLARGDPGYGIPVLPGKYRVTLHQAEIRFPNTNGRVFDVRLEGKTVLDGYMPIRAGFRTADKKAFTVVVGDGFLDIDFIHRSNNPQISAIEVVRDGDAQ